MLRAFRFWLRNLSHRLRGWRAELRALIGGGLTFEACLSAVLINPNGTRVDYGIISRRMVTNAGAAFLVDAWQDLVEIEAMNYHASGTGNTAEAATDTALEAEVATRVLGTQSEAAANILRTVATIPYTATLAIVEHAILSAAVAGVLWDRSVFAEINVVNGASIQFTYDLTVTAGG